MAAPKSGPTKPRVFSQEDYNIIAQRAAVGSTINETAIAIDCHSNTLENNTALMAHYKKHLEQAKISLRRRQVDLALNGADNYATTMLIWLGKNLLGQTDRQEVTAVEPTPHVTKTIILKREKREAPKAAAKEMKDGS